MGLVSGKVIEQNKVINEVTTMRAIELKDAVRQNGSFIFFPGEITAVYEQNGCTYIDTRTSVAFRVKESKNEVLQLCRYCLQRKDDCIVNVLNLKS